MAEPRSGKTVTGLLRRRRLWIIGTVAAFVAAADVIALLTPVTYQASALLVIDQRVTSPTADLNAAITTGQLLAAHYIKMATSTAVPNTTYHGASAGLQKPSRMIAPISASCDAISQPRLRLSVQEVADVPDLAGLLSRRGYQLRMAVSQDRTAESREEVEISPSG